MPPLDSVVTPFWRSITMQPESVVFVARETGAAEACCFQRSGHPRLERRSQHGLSRRRGLPRRSGHRSRGATAGFAYAGVSGEVLAAAQGALTFARTVGVTYTVRPGRRDVAA